jgi:hypothetical protein
MVRKCRACVGRFKQANAFEEKTLQNLHKTKNKFNEPIASLPF